ncbi:acyltransferase family protein [Candidatus Saccharibacteria bacterium]|nr:acyltransferase family protein [Candidatus Saccharibacteria bacterium]
MNNNRIIYFDRLRIIAIFAVVFLHVAAQNYTSIEVNSFEWAVFNFYDGLVRWGVPVFVMISGALFLSKDQPLKKIYKKNILRIAILLLFWSTIYTISSVIAHKIKTPQDFIYNLIRAPGHLWFLYMIMGLYIITPFLRKIVTNKKLAWYFVLLAIVFSFLIPRIIELVGIWAPSLSELLNDVIDMMKINLVLGYSGYYMLGYLLNNTPINKKTEIISYALGLCSLFFSIILTYILSNHLQESNILFYNNLSINVLLISVGIFIFAKKHLNHALGEKNEKRLIFLSKCSLGVYLIHMLILNVLSIVFHIDTLSFNPIFSVPIIAICIFTLSYIVSIIMNKIPFVKKWLV